MTHKNSKEFHPIKNLAIKNTTTFEKILEEMEMCLAGEFVVTGCGVLVELVVDT